MIKKEKLIPSQPTVPEPHPVLGQTQSAAAFRSADALQHSDQPPYILRSRDLQRLQPIVGNRTLARMLQRTQDKTTEEIHLDSPTPQPESPQEPGLYQPSEDSRNKDKADYRVGYEEQEFKAPVFKKDENPKVEDVLQGAIGDCYLLATLIGVVKSDPNRIKKLFKNPDESGPTVTLQFFDVPSKTWEEVTITKKLPVVAQQGEKSRKKKGEPVYAQGAARWPAYVEKAWAAWKNRPAGSKLSYNGIPGDAGLFPYQAMGAILGINGGDNVKTQRWMVEKGLLKNSFKEGSPKLHISPKNAKAIKPKEFLEEIKSALQDKQVIVIGTASHAYAIIGIRESRKSRKLWKMKTYLVIRDPHGRTLEKTPREALNMFQSASISQIPKEK